MTLIGEDAEQLDSHTGMEARGTTAVEIPPDTGKLAPTPVTRQIHAEICTQHDWKLLPKGEPVQECLVQF